MAAWPDTNLSQCASCNPFTTLDHAAASRALVSALEGGDAARKLVVHRAHADGGRGADGCYVPVDDDGDSTFFFLLHIGTEMEAAFVVDGTLPYPENTTNPHFMRFAVDHGFHLPCKSLVEETTTGVLKPKGFVPS